LHLKAGHYTKFSAFLRENINHYVAPLEDRYRYDMIAGSGTLCFITQETQVEVFVRKLVTALKPRGTLYFSEPIFG
jgi:hypothetical protein